MTREIDTFDSTARVAFTHYIPILTTIIAAAFAVVIWRRYFQKSRAPYLLWWGIGVITYGIGTALEAYITLSGNSIFLNKAWYIAGALLGGYPLAQGTVYLLLKKKTANILTWTTVPLIIAISVLVVISPVNEARLLADKPGGAILGWQWIRIFTPLINGYAAVYLIGGAILSAWRFARKRAPMIHVVGNSLIALGALLPGIGGGLAKAGIVEALYVGEFFGIILIWIGYTARVRQPDANRSSLQLNGRNA